MPVLSALLVVLATSPGLSTAVQRALAVPGATARIVDTSVRCEGPFTVPPITRSGRVPVRGKRCPGWGWVDVEVTVSAAVVTGSVGRGEPLAGKWTHATVPVEDSVLPLQALDASATATRPLAPGTVLKAHLVRTGPSPGMPVTVRVTADGLVVEQQGTAVACSGPQACARLPSGRTVRGSIVDGVLVVGGAS